MRTPRLNRFLKFLFGADPANPELADGRVYAYVINDNDSFLNGARIQQSSFPWSGRLFLKDQARKWLLNEVMFSWALLSWSLSISYLQDDSDSEHVFHIAVPPFSFWLSFKVPYRSKFAPKKHREWSIRVFDYAIWWHVGTDPHSWSSKTPKYLEGNWHPLDTFLGRFNLKKTELEKKKVVIPMPEGDYPGTATVTYNVHGRPRWFKRHYYSTWIDMDKGWGIPRPGKGENSWDCDDDAILGTGVNSRNIQEAIGHMVEVGLRDRAKYGGPARWKTYPPPPPPPHTPQDTSQDEAQAGAA